MSKKFSPKNNFNHLTPVQINFEHKNTIDISQSIFENVANTLSIFLSKNNKVNLLRLYGEPNTYTFELIKELINNQEAPWPNHIMDAPTHKDLLGHIKTTNDMRINILDSIFEQYKTCVFIIPVKAILELKPIYWIKIKSILEKQMVYSSREEKNISLNNKMILVGTRDELANLDEYDALLNTNYSMFTDIHDEFKINQNTAQLYLNYINNLASTYNLPTFKEFTSFLSFIKLGMRATNSIYLVPLQPRWIINILTEISFYLIDPFITIKAINQYGKNKISQESYLKETSYEDIRQGHIYIQTSGHKVGQVNGLSVLEISGNPVCFGEPSRISCVIHYGEGEINDLDRKSDLAGNVHAKGMLIMNSFISSMLNRNLPLPFNASIVFEQSYSEIDGDSASLAGLCALLSSLSEKPISQSIAITGSVDQFGQVHSVGGLNEKIEGFFSLCKERGLNGSQGIIMPFSNESNICLCDDIIQAIDENKFHIWLIKDVDEATRILMNTSLSSKEDSSLLSIIESKLIEHSEKLTTYEKIKNIFFGQK